MSDSISQLEEHKDALQLSLDAASARVSKQTAEIKTLEKGLAKEQKRCDSMRTANSKLQHDCNDFAAKVTALETAAEKLRFDADAHCAEMQEKDAAVNDLKRRLDASEAMANATVREI